MLKDGIEQSAFAATICAQSFLRKEIKKFNQSVWASELAALNTDDSSLWKTAKRYKCKRSRIPALTTPAVTAFTNSQKAEMLADSYREQFSENNLSDLETEMMVFNTPSPISSTLLGLLFSVLLTLRILYLILKY
ncbi:hypothetical protein CEXT_604501 [Caerostris extrusa]|uniref:Uncharacterized protein n=1 Tax=Caerostris extrusa TaxID=172846 RepID=A0AAV4RHR9_CAEEX|nr:hypothetical protein CEXT_604501 [Caerostris extrusa]